MGIKKDTGNVRYTGLYEEALMRHKELMIISKQAEEYLAKAPQGTIRISRSDRRPQYYIKKGGNGWKYISKTETAMLRRYLQKSYEEKILGIVDKEIRNLERYIKNSGDIVNKIRQVYSDNVDEVKRLIDPIDCSDDDYIKEWENRAYAGKKISDTTALFETNRKERVRSKSELNIANALASKGIPYKYECPLVINGITVYPDFTVLNVKKRMQMYWEHRGMMDDKDYIRNSVARIKAYMKNGIFVGRNLVITEETSVNPLGTDEIEAVINEFFLT